MMNSNPHLFFTSHHYSELSLVYFTMKFRINLNQMEVQMTAHALRQRAVGRRVCTRCMTVLRRISTSIVIGKE